MSFKNEYKRLKKGEGINFIVKQLIILLIVMI